jgi:hypothetical protein
MIWQSTVASNFIVAASAIVSVIIIILLQFLYIELPIQQKVHAIQYVPFIVLRGL